MGTAKLVALLRKKGLIITTAESCTGGLIAGEITSISGSSDVFQYGFITYANRAKSALLGVRPLVFARNGAVSDVCASAMASGALKRAHADVAISATGIAGPLGGTKKKPVGTVYIGVATKHGCKAYHHRFTGVRAAIRRKTVAAAIRYAIEAAYGI
ncbi:MAG: CinA family protein [Spirochaetota bacterium]